MSRVFKRENTVSEEVLQLGQKEALPPDISKVQQSSKLRIIALKSGQSVF